MALSFINKIEGRAVLPPRSMGCQGCRGGTGLTFEITMAFQPIVDVVTRRVWAYEALVRGADGESAATVLDMVGAEDVYDFDQACRVKAVELAGELFDPDGDELLSINFMPNAVYQPDACIRATLDAARKARFREDRIMFEFTENEKMRDIDHVRHIVESYKKRGFTTAIDDFGAGYAGLGLLAELTPDVIKVDMALVRGIHESAAKRAILAAIVSMTRELDIELLAEGIETREELDCIREYGVRLCQGFLFAKPAIGALPAVCW